MEVECRCCERKVEVDGPYYCGRTYFQLPEGWFLDQHGDKICDQCIDDLRAADNECR